jgi:(2Fe-2S) ferredoxin
MSPTPEQDAALSPIMAAPIERQVFVCTGTSCAANGSEAVLAAFRALLAERQVLFQKGSTDGKVLCTTCGSIGFCAIGPAVLVYPDGVWYAHVQPGDVPEIVDAHILGGKPVERLVRKRVG